jgi:hypothetical protein
MFFKDDKKIPPKVLKVIDDLIESGFPLRSIPALLGNIDVETGGSFDFQEVQGIFDTGPGYGLFQFDEQKPKYFEWLKRSGMKDSSKAQTMFAKNMIYGDSKNTVHDIGYGHKRKLRKSFLNDDVDTMTREIMKRYLRPGVPHEQERVEAARKYKGMLGY